MIQKLRGNNQKGFTLIELMIVIAIIGILAAIAIPNFIAYRNKSFCSATESDANSIAAAIADYFAIPSNVSVANATLILDSTGTSRVRAQLSNNNTWTVDASDVDNIWIQVDDATLRCPEDYRLAMDVNASPRGYWNGNAYFKNMNLAD